MGRLSIRLFLLILLAGILVGGMPVPVGGRFAEDIGTAAASSRSRTSTIQEQGWGSGLRAFFRKIRAKFLRSRTADRLLHSFTSGVATSPSASAYASTTHRRSTWTSTSGRVRIPHKNAFIAYRASEPSSHVPFDSPELPFPPRRDMHLLTSLRTQTSTETETATSTSTSTSTRNVPRGKEVESRRARKADTFPLRHKRPVTSPVFGVSPVMSPRFRFPTQPDLTPQTSAASFSPRMLHLPTSSTHQSAETRQGVDLSHPSLDTFTFPE